MKYRLFGAALVSFVLAVLALLSEETSSPNTAQTPAAQPASSGDSAFKDLKIN